MNQYPPIDSGAAYKHQDVSMADRKRSFETDITKGKGSASSKAKALSPVMGAK